MYLIINKTCHFILCQSSSLIRQQILDPPELLWNRRASDGCFGNIFVFLYHPRIYNFADVKVHSQTAQKKFHNSHKLFCLVDSL